MSNKEVKYMQRGEEIVYARQEGALRENIVAICKKMAKGKSVEQIVDELEHENGVFISKNLVNNSFL